MTRNSRPRGVRAPVPSACQNKGTHTSASEAFYDSVDPDATAITKRTGRISRTAPPLVHADAALWPGWTDVPVEFLIYDAFADDGSPLFGKGGAE